MKSTIGLVLAVTVVASCGTKRQAETSTQTARFVLPPAFAFQASELGLAIEGQTEDGQLYGFGNASLKNEVFARIPQSTLESSDISGDLNRYLEQNPKIASGIYNWERVMADLSEWTKAYPEQAETIVYGTTADQRPLLALHIKAKKTRQENSGIMITGATHGNEILTVDTVMGISSYILKNLQTPRISAILAKHDLWFIPVVSPDSYIDRIRSVEGVDPNREYPWPEKPQRNTTPVIKDLMTFFDSHKMAATLDYHSVAKVVMWPWAYTKTRAKDETKFMAIAKKMTTANRYRSGQISKVMYIATGSSADYYYWKQGSLAMAVELSKSTPSSATTGEEMAKENLESTLGFMEMVD